MGNCSLYMRGERCGEAIWRQTDTGVEITARCAQIEDAIARAVLFDRADRELRIGVMAPHAGELYIKKTFSNTEIVRTLGHIDEVFRGEVICAQIEDDGDRRDARAVLKNHAAAHTTENEWRHIPGILRTVRDRALLRSLLTEPSVVIREHACGVLIAAPVMGKDGFALASFYRECGITHINGELCAVIGVSDTGAVTTVNIREAFGTD